MRPEEQDQSEPILRGEYERRHEELEEKYAALARVTKWVLTLITLGLLITGGTAAWLLNENSTQTDDISKSLVTSCETGGNPARTAARIFGETLILQTEGDIDQSTAFEKSGAYNDLFPGYPHDKLRKLLIKNRRDEFRKIKRLRRGIKKVQPVDCEARF